jgi:hypothetical protein
MGAATSFSNFQAESDDHGCGAFLRDKTGGVSSAGFPRVTALAWGQAALGAFFECSAKRHYEASFRTEKRKGGTIFPVLWASPCEPQGRPQEKADGQNQPRADDQEMSRSQAPCSRKTAYIVPAFPTFPPCWSLRWISFTAPQSFGTTSSASVFSFSLA